MVYHVCGVVSVRLFCEHTQNTDSRMYQSVLQLCICVLHTTIHENLPVCHESIYLQKELGPQRKKSKTMTGAFVQQERNIVALSYEIVFFLICGAVFHDNVFL